MIENGLNFQLLKLLEILEADLNDTLDLISQRKLSVLIAKTKIMNRKQIHWELEIPKGHDIRFPEDPDYITVIARLPNKSEVSRICRGVEFYDRLRTLRDKMCCRLLGGYK